jgi:predicted DNA-binding transcriptional regulator AlpA
VKISNHKKDNRNADSFEMLTAKDLEAVMKIDVKTIYNYVQRGLIPYVRIQSNVRFIKEEIIEWIEMHRYPPRRVNSIRRKSPGERSVRRW